MIVLIGDIIPDKYFLSSFLHVYLKPLKSRLISFLFDHLIFKLGNKIITKTFVFFKFDESLVDTYMNLYVARKKAGEFRELNQKTLKI